jgi:gamma-glutamyl-gamma-aminobutyrate hydrolase PuuD
MRTGVGAVALGCVAVVAQVIDQAGQGVSELCFAGDQLVAAWERSGTEGVVGVFP